MKFIKIFLGAMAGFILGVMLFHPRAASAQGAQAINVTPVSIGGLNSSSGVVSGAVIGFSCVADPDRVDHSVCYIATR